VLLNRTNRFIERLQTKVPMNHLKEVVCRELVVCPRIPHSAQQVPYVANGVGSATAIQAMVSD
jgi:hypothetical protein